MDYCDQVCCIEQSMVFWLAAKGVVGCIVVLVVGFCYLDYLGIQYHCGIQKGSQSCKSPLTFYRDIPLIVGLLWKKQVLGNVSLLLSALP